MVLYKWKIKIYIDTILDYAKVLTSTFNNTKTNGFIGCNFNGELDDVRIYDRELKESEVKAIFDAAFSIN